MARLPAGARVETAISLASSLTKTLLQLAAPTNQRIAITSIYVGFDGTTATDSPATIQMLLQTDAGTGGVATTEFHMDGTTAPTIQTTALHGPWATTEPVASTILAEWFVHPTSVWERLYVPSALELVVGAATRIGVRAITPASAWSTVNAVGAIYWEE
jgi:hypothetical protein